MYTRNIHLYWGTFFRKLGEGGGIALKKILEHQTFFSLHYCLLENLYITFLAKQTVR